MKEQSASKIKHTNCLKTLTRSVDGEEQLSRLVKDELAGKQRETRVADPGEVTCSR